MTIGERIKALRKALNLSAEKFGEQIGITKSSVSRMENGINEPSDATIMLILKTSWNGQYVNETWLRTGEGNMFITLPEEDEYMSYATELSDDKLILATMKEYYKLSEHDKGVVTDFLRNIVKSMDEHRT